MNNNNYLKSMSPWDVIDTEDNEGNTSIKLIVSTDVGIYTQDLLTKEEMLYSIDFIKDNYKVWKKRKVA
jgi:hypothetical protein